jgi:large subunit ribosomal protein L3
VAFGSRKASRVTKPAAGHLAKAGVEAGEILKEFRVTADVASKYAAGTVVPGC